MQELWKRIPGFPDYAASTLGRIKRIVPSRKSHLISRHSILRSPLSDRKYPTVILCRLGVKKQFYVHRLILLTFRGRRARIYQANHRDANKQNNRLNNLEYVTPKGNSFHAHRIIGVHLGEKNPSAKLTTDLVKFIRQQLTPRQLSEKLHISLATVYAIRSHKSWTHIE